MVNPGSSILVLFALAAALAFFFPLFKDGVYKQLSVKALSTAAAPFALVILPFAALFAFAGFLGAEVSVTLPCFVGTALLFFVLSRIGLSPQLRGVALTAAALPLTMHVPQDGGILALSACTMGLLVAKVADVLLLAGDRALDDVVAPLSWLAGVMWLSTFEDQSKMPLQHGILLSIISVCFILRIMQRPFMKDDKWLLKRIILSASGGLGVLIAITKLLLAPDMAKLALLVGAGMFAVYLFKNMDLAGRDEKSSATDGIKMLIVIGMLTMVATRFWGMFGLVALSPLSLLAPQLSMAQLLSLYFPVRVLLEVFITAYNSNVTGINLTHAYTGAAQYAGVMLMAALLLMIREVKDKRLLTAIMLGTVAIAPVASNYYLHAEPTSSLLVVSAVTGTIFAVLGPAFMRDERKAPFEIMLLLPAVMCAVGTTYSGLIEAGTNTTNEFRATILAYAIGAAIVCFIVGWFVSRHMDKGRIVPAASE
ncbi:MAG TPA: hypothetical protein V6D22_23970 [Candidatus Obscuribacterales bacterium]